MIGRILPALGLVGILACAQEESLPEPIIDFNGDGIKDTLCIERRGSIKEPNNYDFVISAMLSDGRGGWRREEVIDSTYLYIWPKDFGSGLLPEDVEAGDWNGDGNLDIGYVMTNGSTIHRYYFLPGYGDGTFWGGAPLDRLTICQFGSKITVPGTGAGGGVSVSGDAIEVSDPSDLLELRESIGDDGK